MSYIRIKVWLLLFIGLGCFAFVNAQEDKKTPDPNVNTETSDDEVLKISSNLIQTGLTVLDQKGQFVNGLRQEDFELRVDGKTVPISFFEYNSAKSATDEKKTQSNPTTDGAKNNVLTNPERRGRNVIFVVDDLHLSFDSNRRTRDLILKFIDQKVEPEDLVAIVSPSGKVGFLQQFTNDKMVLKEAVGRLLNSRDTSSSDRQSPPMSLYEAQLIDRRDPQVTDVFANLLIAELGPMDIETAREIVRQRARSALQNAAVISINTYNTLEQSIRRSAQLPGRKTVFLISDGFLLDVTNTQASYRLQRITDAAARANAVIYSFDANGLEAGFPDNTSRSYSVQSGERFELGDPLNVVAEETGGKFIKNTNDLQGEVIKAFEETSVYYLLAWQPDAEDVQSEKLKRIEVTVKNRPELKVRLQSGYLNEKKIVKTSSTKPVQTSAPTPEQELRSAALSQIPIRGLSTFLALNYLDSQSEPNSLSIALKIKSESVEFVTEGSKSVANVALLGYIFDADGKRIGGFSKTAVQELGTVDKNLVKTDRSDIFYNYKIGLKAGLYQVRVAARDEKAGTLGSAVQWIKIPDLASRKLALSSLLIGEKTDTKERQSSEPNIAGAEISVDRIFTKNSQLRYIIFIYNAGRGKSGATPDVTIQTQIFRGKTVLMDSPARPVSSEGQDPARLAYAAEISLNTLPAGRYTLQVSVQERTGKNSAVQQVGFEIK